MTGNLDSLLQQLKTIDAEFSYRAFAPDNQPWFRSISGTAPVLISAPHACMHRRDGKDKMQEEYTGAIAFYLAKVCQCSAIATCYQTDQDPNWDASGDYKTEVESLVVQNKIKFLIDLHGMTNKYNLGIAIGTMKGSACSAEQIAPHFVKSGFGLCQSAADQTVEDWRNMMVDHPKFTGGLVNNTVTRFASQQLNIPAVQIELASSVRVVESVATEDWPHDYYGNPVAIHATVNALKSLARQFQ